MDARELETATIAATFRPNHRPLALAVLANVVLAALLLGLPYQRGRNLAQGQREHFAQLAQCLLGGERRAASGFGIPRGDRAHFASNVLLAHSNWPLSCRASLDALAPQDAIFLWPSVKRAGADVRAAVELLDKELVELHRARARGVARVPQRPLDALARVQAALTLMASAADVEAGVDTEAIRFRSTASLPEPARLPLKAAEGAALELTTDSGTLEAVALDGRGLSWIRLAAGKLDRERIKRPGLLRRILRSGTQHHLIWAMPEARCREREDLCASRATGIAAYERGAKELPAPIWLAGHPAARIDRTLRIDDHEGLRLATLVARARGGAGLELRTFELPQAAILGAGEGPISAQAVLPLEVNGAHDVVLAANRSVILAKQTDAGVSAQLVFLDPKGAVELADATGTGPLIATCNATDTTWFVHGSHTQQHVLRVGADRSWSTPTSMTLRLQAPIDPEEPARDRLRLICTGAGAQVLAIDDHETLWSLSCTNTGTCQPPHPLAKHVARFSAAIADATTIVAFSGTPPAREIRVLRLASDGSLESPARAPAACWEPFGGFCGIPTLAHDGERIVLAAREGEDLLAIESVDAGARFTALSGLVTSRPRSESVTDPLQQHRIRKGVH